MFFKLKAIICLSFKNCWYYPKNDFSLQLFFGSFLALLRNWAHLCFTTIIIWKQLGQLAETTLRYGAHGALQLLRSSRVALTQPNRPWRQAYSRTPIQ